MAQSFNQLVDSLNLTYPVKEIAARTGYTKGNVSIFLSNKKEPTKAFLKKFYEVFNLNKKDRGSTEVVTYNKELPGILGEHEVRLVHLESFMQVTVPTVAELKAVNKINGVNVTKDDIVIEITTLKEQILEFSKKHLLELQMKLF